MNGHDLLRDLLASWDVEAFGETLAAELVPQARREVPELAFVDDETLRDLLGAAGLHGATALVGAAQMHLAVIGPGGDSALEALATTVEGVRIALSLLTPDPALSFEEREASALRGLDHLARIVTSWDRAQAAACTD